MIPEGLEGVGEMSVRTMGANVSQEHQAGAPGWVNGDGPIPQQDKRVAFLAQVRGGGEGGSV